MIYDRDFAVYYIGGTHCKEESYKYSFTASYDFWNNTLIYGVSEELNELADDSETKTKLDEKIVLQDGFKYVFDIDTPADSKPDRVAFRVNRDSLIIDGLKT